MSDILGVFLSQGMCAGLNDVVTDATQIIGGTEFAYIVFYSALIIILVLLMALTRSLTFGAISGITFFSIMLLAGRSGCLPLPSSINTIVAVMVFIMTVTIGYAIKEARS